MNENDILGISRKDAQTLLNYIITQPYKDVFQIVQMLMNLQQVSTAPEPPPPHAG